MHPSQGTAVEFHPPRDIPAHQVDGDGRIGPDSV
ncbi:uncharacterized protein METZ01_LOCUS57938 [marine metagenome]|uniref:Uncharacterized protein n=1 Tax=marine metagenome TaxID=408172 RepID=A0A381SNT0_9ZZZZ